MPGLIDEKKAKKRALAANDAASEEVVALFEKSKKKAAKVTDQDMAAAPAAKKLKAENGEAAAAPSTPAKPAQAKAAGAMSAAEFTKAHDLRTMGTDVPEAFQTFEAAGFSSDIMNEIRKAGFSAPSPIQAQAWPIALSGRDMVAIAKTGSGKTCGFLLPGMMHIKATRKDAHMGPTMLVLAPTRELAVQIKCEADKFGRSSGIKNTCAYGGAPRGPQLRDLRAGVQILIATPGRLNDYIEAGQVNLSQVSYLVLDEADRMLDMGFEPAIRAIVGKLPESRQTIFFSATWPKEVKKIAAQFVTNNTVHVFVGSVSDKLVANKAITQKVKIIQGMSEKTEELSRYLRTFKDTDRVIIFCKTKRMCDSLVQAIGHEFWAASIHGDKQQWERDKALKAFREGSMPVLIATDVAARGLDIPDVRSVVNFDFPMGIEDYVHRIGRTGRGGATGESFTFFSRDDGKNAGPLVQLMREAGQEVPPELEALVSRGGGGGGGNRWGGGGGGYGGGNKWGGGGGGGGGWQKRRW